MTARAASVESTRPCSSPSKTKGVRTKPSEAPTSFITSISLRLAKMEPYGVRDEEYARDEEQQRRPVEAPDHDRRHRAETVDGLLRVAKVVLRKAFLL